MRHSEFGFSAVVLKYAVISSALLSAHTGFVFRGIIMRCHLCQVICEDKIVFIVSRFIASLEIE